MVDDKRIHKYQEKSKKKEYPRLQGLMDSIGSLSIKKKKSLISRMKINLNKILLAKKMVMMILLGIYYDKIRC